MMQEYGKCGAIYRAKVKGWKPRTIICECVFCKAKKEVKFLGDEQ